MELPPPAVLRLAPLAVLLVAAGCAPSIAPTYRDYRVPDALERATGEERSLEDELRAALADAGWTEAEPDAPNVITTEPRRIDSGLFSHVDATLDLAPVGGPYVRVYVHAVRRNVFGSRSKQPYLSRGLRENALRGISDALAARGLVALDAPRERDEEATD